MPPYSLDLRQRVLAAVDAGQHSRAQLASLFRVSTAWIRRLVQRRRQTGAIAPLAQRRGPAPALDDGRRQRLAQLVRETPDATLAELRDRLGGVSVSTVWRALAALGLTRKKSHCTPARRAARTCRRSAPSSASPCRPSTRRG